MSKKAEQVFNNYMEKQAKILNLSDIENELGVYISDKQEPAIRRLIAEQYEKRTPLRHPILTGIPTLGIAPAVSKAKAMDEVIRRSLRKDVQLRNTHEHYKQLMRDRALEDYKLESERLKNTQAERVAGQAVQGLGMYLGSKGNQD